MKIALGPYEEAVRSRAAALAPGVERIWSRDASFWGGDAARATSVSNRLGWLDVAAQMRERVDEITSFADQVRADGFTDAVVLGMGGSSLAPEVLRQSIGDTIRLLGPQVRLHVLDSTDPATILSVTGGIDAATTLFFVSSKSGTTLEANALYAYCRKLVLGRKGERAGGNFVAITDDGTPLQKLAADAGFRRCFVNPSDIGGRYSALSYFGLVPAAVAGVDIARLLDRGIAEMEATRTASSEALLLGAALGELALAGRDKCTFVVSDAVASFGLWVEQLIAESTGKEGRGILPVADEPLVWDLKVYSDDRAFVYLRLNAVDNLDLDDAMQELEEAGHPVITIELDDVYDLGREFFRWEFAVAVTGQVLGINPFDEPNVQESKDNTSRVLEEFERTGKLEIDAAEPGSKRMQAELDRLVEAITSGDYFAITAYVEPTSHTAQELTDIRESVLMKHHVATTSGHGPRFLHSTGQLHKGGPATGVFLQILGDYAEDIPIPGKPFTFGQLKRAQAIGDREALIMHGRPVVTVDIGNDELRLEELCAAISEATEDGG